MTVRPILTVPEHTAVLTAKALPVSMTDHDLAGLITDLKDTLRATKNGVGLAAPQIGVLKRVFALKRSFIRDDLDPQSPLCAGAEDILIFINPKIIATKDRIDSEEGCLSAPSVSLLIPRARTVKIKYLTEDGLPAQERFTGLASRAVQQEIDHLNGVLIVDYAA